VKFGIGPECIKTVPGINAMMTEEEVDTFLFNKKGIRPHGRGITPDEAKNQLSHFRDKPWRKFQKEAVQFATESTKRFRVVEAPTGSGKSLLAMTCGVMVGDATYLCSTKMLQTQIVADFPESKVLWGRGNYLCLLDDTKNCDQCASTKNNPCPVIHKCLYKKAKQEVLDSSLRILNYSYYLTEIAYAGRFKGSPFCIIDEADSLEGTLVNHISLSFSERSLFRLGLQNGPSRKTVTSKDGISSWQEFGKEALYRSKSIYEKLNKEIDGYDTIEEDWQFTKIRERDHFKHLWERCQIFLNNVDSSWIMEEQERVGSRQAMTTFRPLWITNELAESFLWSSSQNWLLMSASFLPVPVLAKTLGIDPDEIDYMSVQSTFPVENRPINIWPVCSITAKTVDAETPKLIVGIKKILDRHKGERGLIHTASFKLANSIIAKVGSKRLITHTSQDRQDVVDSFMGTDDDTVLVSPSLERGINLEGDLCRFIIIAKALFLSLGDRVTSQRVYSSAIGKFWYSSQMMLSVLQACGRGMRSESDTCTVYIIDDQVNRVYLSKPSLWPQWFRDGITWSDNELLES
jgi:Rad3-related DNA helicase